MRYMGVHPCPGSETVWPQVTKAEYHICIQEGYSNVNAGDVFTVALNSSDEKIEGVPPHTVMFWENGKFIEKGTQTVPSGVLLWPTMTQQTKNDTVTANWQCDVPFKK